MGYIDLLNAVFLSNLSDYHHCRKLDPLQYIVVADSVSLTPTTVVCLKATEFGKITRNNGRYAT